MNQPRRFCELAVVLALIAGQAALSSQSSAATPMIAAADAQTLVLKSNGSVMAWGYNGNGQLGDGTTTQRSSPVSVPGLSGITAVTMGLSHAAALKSDGTVVAWGYNYAGQLGDGSTQERHTPTTVSNLTGVTAIATGCNHTVALKSDGTVVSWGGNGNGELGDGTQTNRNSPVTVSGLSGVTAIAAGCSHTVVLKSDGTVVTWGDNAKGQLGNGTTIARSQGAVVSGLTGIIAVSAGTSHTIALKSDGSVMGWGANSYGELGDGSLSNRSTPIAVPGLSGIVAVSAQPARSFALKGDGTLMAWGYNGSGQLGDGTTTSRNKAVAVTGLTGVVSVAGGGNHSLALKSDGTIVGWGSGEYGALGDGSSAATNHTSPSLVAGGLNLGASTIATLPDSNTIPTIVLGKASSLGITAKIAPPPGDVGRAFPLYLAAELGGNWYLRGTGLTDWTRYQGGQRPVAQQVTAMPTSLEVDVINLDLSSVPSLNLYAGYGDTNAPGYFNKILTVQKRATVDFSNTASPVSVASTSSYGWSFVTRRATGGSTGDLDVVQPNGTQYQIGTGSAGLPELRFGGNRITLLAKDANNQPTLVVVRTADGTEATVSRDDIAVTRKATHRAENTGGGECDSLVVSRAPPAPPSDIVARTCANPDGTTGLDDNRRELTLACEQLLGHGHPTFVLIRGLIDFTIDQYEKKSRMVDAVGATLKRTWGCMVSKLDDIRDNLNDAEKERDDTATDLVSERPSNQVGSKVYDYTGTLPLSGSDEADAKALSESTKKIATDQIDPAALAPSQFKVVNTIIACGANMKQVKDQCVPDCTPPMVAKNLECVMPTPTCTAPAVEQNGACVTPSTTPDAPTIDSVSPTQATKGQQTVFTVSGTNLTSGMGFTLESCESITELPGGSDTQRQFACTPSYAAPREGAIKDTPFGKTLYVFHVQVGVGAKPNNTLTFSKPQPALNGKSISAIPFPAPSAEYDDHYAPTEVYRVKSHYFGGSYDPNQSYNLEITYFVEQFKYKKDTATGTSEYISVSVNGSTTGTTSAGAWEAVDFFLHPYAPQLTRPISGNGNVCYVTGMQQSERYADEYPNTPNYPSCASDWNITIDRQAGTATFNGTPMKASHYTDGDDGVDTSITGSFGFTPLTPASIKAANDQAAAAAAAAKAEADAAAAKAEADAAAAKAAAEAAAKQASESTGAKEGVAYACNSPKYHMCQEYRYAATSNTSPCGTTEDIVQTPSCPTSNRIGVCASGGVFTTYFYTGYLKPQETCSYMPNGAFSTGGGTQGSTGTTSGGGSGAGGTALAGYWGMSQVATSGGISTSLPDSGGQGWPGGTVPVSQADATAKFGSMGTVTSYSGCGACGVGSKVEFTVVNETLGVTDVVTFIRKS